MKSIFWIIVYQIKFMAFKNQLFYVKFVSPMSNLMYAQSWYTVLYLPPPRCCLPGLINFDHKCLILLLFQVINSSDRPEDFHRRLRQDICLVLKGRKWKQISPIVSIKNSYFNYTKAWGNNCSYNWSEGPEDFYRAVTSLMLKKIAL